MLCLGFEPWGFKAKHLCFFNLYFSCNVKRTKTKMPGLAQLKNKFGQKGHSEVCTCRMILIKIPQTSIEQQISLARWIADGFSSYNVFGWFNKCKTIWQIGWIWLVWPVLDYFNFADLCIQTTIHRKQKS